MTTFTIILLAYIILDIVMTIALGIALKVRGSSLMDVVYHVARFLKYGYWIDDYDLEREGIEQADDDEDEGENEGGEFME